MRDPIPARFQALLDAGFTHEELLALAEALSFAATIAMGYDQSVNLTPDWTPEKKAAFEEFTRATTDTTPHRHPNA